MELFVERKLSAYEIERNKPEPTFLHGAIQANLSFELAVKYSTQFRIANEVTLGTNPINYTPDIILYPFRKLDFKNDPEIRLDAPLLSVEIQSASQSTKDMTSKLESCWIVVPELKAVIVYDSPYHYNFFHEKDMVKDSVVGIEILVEKIFE
jgi:hypothetical protein